jgi:sporulation-control protein
MALLSRFGIGSATIDLIPEQTTVRPGEKVAAHLEIEGGTSAQTVDDTEIALVTRYQAQHGDDSSPTHYVLWETEFREGFTVEAGVDRTIDVPPIQVPSIAPVTKGTSEVWIQTGLDIDWAVDPSDEDQLEVEPGGALQPVLDAMEQLGFGLRTVTNEETDNRLTPLPFVQRFAFRGGGGDFAGKLDDLFLAPLPSDDGDALTVLMWVDRIGERDIGDVRRARLSVETDDAEAIAEQFRGEIESRL